MTRVLDIFINLVDYKSQRISSEFPEYAENWNKRDSFGQSFKILRCWITFSRVTIRMTRFATNDRLTTMTSIIHDA